MYRALVLACLVFAAATAASGQNLLTNPDFDNGLDGWLVLTAPDAPEVSWETVDSDGDPTSGSVSVTNEDPDALVGLLGLFQCVSVGGGAAYRLETDLREAGGTVGEPSSGSIVITWFDAPNCTGNDIDFSGATTPDDRTDWRRVVANVTAPAAAQSAAVGLWVFKDDAGGAYQAFFDDPLFAPINDGSCSPDATSLCLNNGRFRVSANWRRPDGTEGQGQAVMLTEDTGYFWFFNSANVEMVVKVLNGCLNNNRYWVFAGGLTNVEVELTVEDTGTSTEVTYLNPQRTPFQPIQDTNAFATCP